MDGLDQNNKQSDTTGNGSGETQATGTSVLDAFKGAGSGGNQEPTNGNDNAKRSGQANKEAETYALKAWEHNKKVKKMKKRLRFIKFEDISGLANSYIELEKKNKEYAHTIPGEKATQRSSMLFITMGKPEAADKYSF